MFVFKKILKLSPIAMIFYFAGPAVALAVQLIVPIPGSPPEGISDPGIYIKTIYNFGIGIAGLLAMAQIVFGGVQYTVSAGDPSKQSDAKDRIWSAITGLILLLASYLILNTINPQLTKLALEGKTQPIPGIDTRYTINSMEYEALLNADKRRRAEEKTMDGLLADLKVKNDALADARGKYTANKTNENELAYRKAELAAQNALVSTRFQADKKLLARLNLLNAEINKLKGDSERIEAEGVTFREWGGGPPPEQITNNKAIIEQKTAQALDIVNRQRPDQERVIKEAIAGLDPIKKRILELEPEPGGSIFNTEF